MTSDGKCIPRYSLDSPISSPSITPAIANLCISRGSAPIPFHPRHGTSSYDFLVPIFTGQVARNIAQAGPIALAECPLGNEASPGGGRNAWTSSNMTHGRVLLTSGFNTRLQHINVSTRESEQMIPSLRVFLKISRHRQIAIQKQPPSPSKVIAFIIGVSQSAFSAC